MPTPPDIEQLTYSRIRQILESDTDWSAQIDLANRIWFDVESPTAPEKPNVADSDYPQSKLRLRAGSTRLYTADETFETYSSSGPAQWLEKGSMIFRLTIWSQLLGQKEQSNLRKLSVNALRKAGPRLGLDFLTSVRLNYTTELRVESDEGEGMIREVSDIDIVLEFEKQGRILTGESS